MIYDCIFFKDSSFVTTKRMEEVFRHVVFVLQSITEEGWLGFVDPPLGCCYTE
jgi:hypothetical protein